MQYTLLPMARLSKQTRPAEPSSDRCSVVPVNDNFIQRQQKINTTWVADLGFVDVCAKSKLACISSGNVIVNQ